VDSGQTKRWVGLRSWGRGCGSCLLLFIVFLLCLFWYIKKNQVRHVNIRGRVVEDVSGNPVPGARVILKTYFSRFLYNPIYFFGVVADAEGHFVIDTDVPDPVHEIWIEASGPENTYASKTFKVAEMPDDITLRLGLLPEELRKYDGAKYKRFTGSSRPRSRKGIKFIGKGWETRTLSEIESGDPPAKVRPENTTRDK